MTTPTCPAAAIAPVMLQQPVRCAAATASRSEAEATLRQSQHARDAGAECSRFGPRPSWCSGCCATNARWRRCCWRPPARKLPLPLSSAIPYWPWIITGGDLIPDPNSWSPCQVEPLRQNAASGRCSARRRVPAPPRCSGSASAPWSRCCCRRSCSPPRPSRHATKSATDRRALTTTSKFPGPQLLPDEADSAGHVASVRIPGHPSSSPRPGRSGLHGAERPAVVRYTISKLRL